MKAPLNLIAFLLALALAGCFECKPGDETTTNHRPICQQRSSSR